MKVCTYDAVYGFVDYGDIDDIDTMQYVTKERCKMCGAAWLAENYIDGHYTCPKCGATDNDIMHIG